MTMSYELGTRLDRLEAKLDFIIEQSGFLKKEKKVENKVVE